jgi:hypothetical protein
LGRVGSAGPGSFEGMRRLGLGLMLMVALALPASAVAAGHSGISGSLYDTTCGSGCEPPCPPPCHLTAVICAQPRIVCPQATAEPAICLPGGCGVQYPLYEGTDATITVRRAGSRDVMRTVAPHEGHFFIRLGPGRYALRGHVAQPCWVGEKAILTVERDQTTVAALDVRDNCVVHPDAAK